MHDSIVRNNHVSNTTSGITVSESPNTRIYNNTIEGATSQGIRLFNPPEPPYDGLTENNLVYNNIIASSEDFIIGTNSQEINLENNRFSNVQSSKDRLTGDSIVGIREDHFDNA